MGFSSILLVCCLAVGQAEGASGPGAGGPAVVGTTLAGQTVEGELLGLADGVVRLGPAGTPKELPVDQLMELRPSARVAARAGDVRRTVVTLVDGGRLSGASLSLKGAQGELTGLGAKPVVVPVSSIAHVLFAQPTGKAAELWAELVAKESRKDLLVIRKGETADYLSGLVGDLGEKLSFTLDGEEVPVAREKILGVIYARRAAVRTKSACLVQLGAGDRLTAVSVEPAGELVRVKTAGGASVSVPWSLVEVLDFSAGKVDSLSRLAWRSVRFVPYFDSPDDREYFQPRKDSALGNLPLRLGGKTFRQGLWIHSKATVSYRLGGEYRRLQAVMGIDDQVEERAADVDVVIKGDEKVLFEGVVKWGDAAKALDLDLTGVRDLEISVGFGPSGYGFGDQLVLGDARLLK
jgi:hypothetical protein